jgi:hypothetical protein
MDEGRHHWSHTANSARFGPINAVASVPWLALLLHPCWWLLWVALALTGFLFWVEKIKKMTITAFFRSINILFTGRVKSSLNLFKELTR